MSIILFHEYIMPLSQPRLCFCTGGVVCFYGKTKRRNVEMQKEIQVKVYGSEVLNRVSRMFDGTPRSVLRELMQNARRAGATKIDISFIDGTLTIAHDGLAFEDFGKLFSLGSSGWKKQGIKNEDPAGMGFFVSTLFESVEIISRKDGNSAYIVKATKEQLTRENSKLEVKIEKFNDSIHNVEFRLHNGVEIEEHDYREVAEHFPVPSAFTMLIDGVRQTVSEEYRLNLANNIENNPRQLERVVNGVRMFFRKVDNFSYTYNSLYFNYHGHAFRLYSYIEPLVKSVMQDGLTLVVLPEENSKIHLTLPARDSIVEDKTYYQMLDDIKDMLAEYVNVQSGHDLPYKAYSQLGGAEKIKQEAAVPKGLKKYWYSGNHNLDILFYDADNVVNSYLFPYEGYNWYSDYTQLTVDNVALRVTSDGKVSVIPLNALAPREDEVQAGLVDSLEVIYVQPGQEPELIRSLEQAVLLGEDNENLYGYFEPYADDRVWIRKGADINNILYYLEDCLVSLWEPNDSGECDSWETQQEEFRNALCDWWEGIFLPESKDCLSIERAVNRTRWQFGSAELMVIKKDAIYLSGITGSVVKLMKQDESAVRKIVKQQEKILTA
jgi:hypothetical protein